MGQKMLWHMGWRWRFPAVSVSNRTARRLPAECSGRCQFDKLIAGRVGRETSPTLRDKADAARIAHGHVVFFACRLL